MKHHKKKTIKQVQAYRVLLRKGRKYQPIAYGLTKGEALKFGSERALRDIARTFKIIPSGTKEVFGMEEDFMPSDRLFRGYQVRRCKAIPLSNTFIQRTSANLQSREEKYQIAEAKRLKKLIGF